ncbi:MAG: TIGR04283 family arsenosugar biosynthesis glycosyltransferase [Acidobacteria bacterium]|jgi:rSAM/selenodomain-associated transferase 2|nr:TIGR04283 family arsenosugar biosynthesis glycosyltransferase [Acidobacteriota bacterium]
MKPEISIVIPTLDEEFSIRRTLESLENFDENFEIIVVDGGSEDATLEIAENYNVVILHSPRGRGRQLQIGANAASGEILWFLHADTVPAPDCVRQMKRVLQNKNVVGGNFTIRFDGERMAAKFLTWLYPNLRKIGLIYGDSAIFVRREVYERIGGFQSFPIFEDLDFIERLKKTGEIVTLPAAVTTSSRRFENKSFVLTFLRWTILQVLYWLGVSPETLLKIYFPK